MSFRELLERSQVSLVLVARFAGINYLKQHRFANVTFDHADFRMAGNKHGTLKAGAEHGADCTAP